MDLTESSPSLGILNIDGGDVTGVPAQVATRGLVAVCRHFIPPNTVPNHAVSIYVGLGSFQHVGHPPRDGADPDRGGPGERRRERVV